MFLISLFIQAASYAVQKFSFSNIGLCTFPSSGEREARVSEELFRLGAVPNACSSRSIFLSQ